MRRKRWNSVARVAAFAKRFGIIISRIVGIAQGRVTSSPAPSRLSFFLSLSLSLSLSLCLLPLYRRSHDRKRRPVEANVERPFHRVGAKKAMTNARD